MADSDKDILITPNVGVATVFPKIEFTGFDNNAITLSVLDDGTLSFDGSSGQLFSVADSMTGTIFSVNDVSGIPSIEVIDDGTVILAEFSGDVGVGTDTPTSKFTVVGGDIRIGLYATTDSGKLLLTGSTINKVASLECTNGNLHIDSNTGQSTYINFYAGNGTLFGDGASNTVAVMGADGDLWKGSADNTGDRYFNDGYHPNADAWATGRTITLTGDVTGTSASWTGSGNISFATTVANDSHTHNNYIRSDANDTTTGNLLMSNDASALEIRPVGATQRKHPAILLRGASAGIANYILSENDNVYIGTYDGGSPTDESNMIRFQPTSSLAPKLFVGDAGSTGAIAYIGGDTVFHDTYHPNADTWTTGRTITLTGDVTGTSAAWTGSGNISFVATVANNSHTHTSANITDATSANTANVIVERDASGNFSAGTITATLFNGLAASAKYADLAEKYLGDDEYEVGTVVSVGGIKEITATTPDNQHSILGVISDAPAYLMNAELEGGQPVALKGRVPVKVTGTINKGDRLVASPLRGIAMADNDINARSFAIALEDNISGVIEAVIL